jgi:hypothetical protein
MYTGFPKPSCVVCKSCFKAAWELQIAFLLHPGNFWTLQEALETTPVGFPLKKMGFIRGAISVQSESSRTPEKYNFFKVNFCLNVYFCGKSARHWN